MTHQNIHTVWTQLAHLYKLSSTQSFPHRNNHTHSIPHTHKNTSIKSGFLEAILVMTSNPLGMLTNIFIVGTSLRGRYQLAVASFLWRLLKRNIKKDDACKMKWHNEWSVYLWPVLKKMITQMVKFTLSFFRYLTLEFLTILVISVALLSYHTPRKSANFPGNPVQRNYGCSISR